MNNLKLKTEPLQPPTTKELEEALKELVDALMAHRRRQARAAEKLGPYDWQAGIVSGAQLLATPSEHLDQRSWVDDPIDRALKDAMRVVGQHLATRLGSTKELGIVGDRIAKRSYAQRWSAMDSAFDGIRVGDDVWAS
jgi:hypothetical protein